MKRLIALLIIVVMMLGNVCLAEDDVVRVWHTYNERQLATMQAIADAFNAQTDGPKILLEEQPSSGFMDSVYAAVANHTGPDIIFNFATTAADFVDGGLVAEMDAYMDVDAYRAGAPEGVYSESVGFSDGHIHIIAIQMTGPVLYYNKTVYDELNLSVPQTWDELIHNAQVIRDNTGMAGLVVDSVCDLIQTRMMQNGSEYVDVENRCVAFDKDVTIDVMNWFAESVQSGAIETNLTGEYGYVDLNAQLAGMYIGSCGAMPSIEQDEFEVGVVAVPQDGPVKWFPAWDRGGIVFSSTPEKEKAAVEFLTFLTSDENSAAWCMTLGALSPRTGAANVEAYAAYVEENPALVALQSSLSYVGYVPSVPGIYSTRNALEKAALQVASGALSAEDAYNQAVQEANDILKR